MKSLILARKKQHLSQRKLAHLSDISYKTLQLLEQDADARLSTLSNLAQGFGYSKKVFLNYVEDFFSIPPHSVIVASQKILVDGFSSWKIHLFDFVDEFRHRPDFSLIEHMPVDKLHPKIRALFASTVECLCEETGLACPAWTQAILPLTKPWFVAEVENLKATALLESPTHLRKRDIFVLGNFLSRM